MTTMNGTAAMTLAGTGPTTVKADQTRAFEPRDIGEGYDLAKLLVGSGLLGRNVTRPEQAFAIIAAGRELGLTAMQSLRSIHIIEGKPTLSADLIAALCKSRPDVCQYFQLVESTDKVARYKTHRKGDPEPTIMSFSIEDAQRAQVTGKDNWKKYPAAMLRARCITALARAVYPDLAMGIYDPDEVGDAQVGPSPVYEVVSPPVAPAIDDKTFRRLCERVDEAENVATLNGIASATAKAHKARAITDDQFAAIKSAVTKKRGLIGGPSVPTPPPSAPDQDPNNGAEIDEMQELHREPGEEG